jgi:DNA-binding GntR family transcriptional regulator
MSGALDPHALRAFMTQAEPGDRTVEEAVTDALREAILRGVLPPGQRLRQELLAAELGVSRIPLRDAFRRLSAEGLIHIDGRRGARVASLTAADASELYELRRMLEMHCLRLAIGNLTEEGAARLLEMAAHLDPAAGHRASGAVSARGFYTELYRWSGRPRMASTIIQLRHELNRYHALLDVPLHSEIHGEVREAIRTRDAAVAALAMRQHLRRSRNELVAVLRKSSAPGARPRRRPAPRG